MNNPSAVITIDGPSASGKSSVAFLVAKRLGLAYMNSGCLYRYMAHLWQAQDFRYQPGQVLDAGCFDFRLDFVLADRLRILHGDQDVSSILEDDALSNLASRIAAYPEVRSFLLGLQHSYAVQPGLVTDGRDMGLVVFPSADMKIFLTATLEERANRRAAQLSGRSVSQAVVAEQIRLRDKRDMERSAAPLKPADDAIVIDTTQMQRSAVVDQICAYYRKKCFPT
tara:strand:+ start:841 stop:1515 length:675 start_codon:yes stop_codon:yes gene_type:complete